MNKGKIVQVMGPVVDVEFDGISDFQQNKVNQLAAMARVS